MPTIKDVAKLAGVSHGTVSNVINGAKSVNSQIVKRVRNAMEELGYQPDAKARSMRNSKTRLIGVVLPDITQPKYAKLYTGLELKLRSQGYILCLFCTQSDRESEIKALTQICQQRMDALVIVTCMPDAAAPFEQIEKSGIPIIFVDHQLNNMKHRIFASFDQSAYADLTARILIGEGHTRIGIIAGRKDYSNELSFIEGIRESYEQNGIPLEEALIRQVPEGKEQAFRIMSDWNHRGLNPSAVITTNTAFYQGASAAVSLFYSDTAPVLLNLDTPDWCENICDKTTLKVEQDYRELGERAASFLLQKIGTKEFSETVNLLISPGASTAGSTRDHIRPHTHQEKYGTKSVPYFLLKQYRRPVCGMQGYKYEKRPLRLLMLQCASAKALDMIKDRFTKEWGIPVVIDMIPYDALYDKITGQASSYDMIQMDISWMAGPLKDKILCELQTDTSVNDLIIRSFPEGILKKYDSHSQKRFGLPFMFDAQILFYRKDLFEDLQYQRMYYEQFKKELRIPRTWEEYNQIARFFTKSYNTDSPVPYGSTAGGAPYNSVYELMPRIWDQGITLDASLSAWESSSSVLVDGLKDYKEVFSYADPKAAGWNWTMQTEAFHQGNAAMMVLYQAHFSDYFYALDSKISNNIGFAPIPGSSSVEGGWLLGIHKQTQMYPEAAQFFQWLLQPDIAAAFNLLGGTLPVKQMFTSNEMKDLYPWLKQSLNIFSHSRPMLQPLQDNYTQWEFEKAAGRWIHEYIAGRISERETLAHICKEYLNI